MPLQCRSVAYNICIKTIFVLFLPLVGFVSYRYGSSGSPFIQAVVKVISQEAHKEDLLGMATMVVITYFITIEHFLLA